VIPTNDQLALAFAVPGGGFQNPSVLDVAGKPVSIAAADLTGNGHRDLLVVLRDAGALQVFEGDGNGTFVPRKAFTVSAPEHVVVADFSGDDLDDVAVLGSLGVSLLARSFEGGLDEPVLVIPLEGRTDGRMVAGNFDNSGRAGLALVHPAVSEVFIYTNIASAPAPLLSSMAVGAEPVDLAAGDVDGDRRPDLAVACRGTSSIFLAELGEEGRLVPQGEIPLESPPLRIVLSVRRLDEVRFRRGDCNGDGLLDIADAVAVLDLLFIGDFKARCKDACDFNDDGKLDISDAIASLAHQFLGDIPPAPPGMKVCGLDPAPDVADPDDPPGDEIDQLDCEDYPPHQCDTADGG